MLGYSTYRYGVCKRGNCPCTGLSVCRQSLRPRDALPELVGSPPRAEQQPHHLVLPHLRQQLFWFHYYHYYQWCYSGYFCLEFWSAFISSCLVFLLWLLTVHSTVPRLLFSRDATWRLPIYPIQVPRQVPPNFPHWGLCNPWFNSHLGHLTIQRKPSDKWTPNFLHRKCRCCYAIFLETDKVGFLVVLQTAPPDCFTWYH